VLPDLDFFSDYMDPALTPSMLSGTPKADGTDWTPSAKLAFAGYEGWGGMGGDEGTGMEGDMSMLNSANVTAAAYHADVAAKHAASTASHATLLAQWVQHLWYEHEALQAKVKELEDWKRRTLEDMRKLRDEHKLLRKKFGGGEEAKEESGVKKAMSMPVSSAQAETPMSGPPPGLALPELPRMVTTSSAGEDDFSTSSPTMKEDGDGKNEGVNVIDAHNADGTACQKAEWRIGHLSVKLRGCMGRALVSPPFTAWGMEDLRLMIYPDQKESATGPRSRRQKELYNKKVSDGPLDGCLKLKVPNCPAPHTLEYYLTVGASDANRKGPFTHNFAECTVSDPAEFGMDWLLQVDGDGGLTVSVDIMEMKKPQ